MKQGFVDSRPIMTHLQELIGSGMEIMGILWSRTEYKPIVLGPEINAGCEWPVGLFSSGFRRCFLVSMD